MFRDKKFLRSVLSEYLVFWFFLFILNLILQREFVFSNMMIFDDSHFVTGYFHGYNPKVSSQFVHYFLLELTTFFNSPWLVKFFSIMTLATIGTLAAAILRRHTFRPILAYLGAVVLSTYPVSLNQGFFVLGSHPALAAAFALGAMLCFLSIRGTTAYTSLVLLVAACLIGYLTGTTSPLGFLMPFAPLIWFLLDKAVFKSRVPFLPGLIFVTGTASLTLLGHFGEYHYTERTGKLNKSVSNYFDKLFDFLSIVISPLVNSPLILQIVYAVGLFMLLGFIFYGCLSTKDSKARRDEYTSSRILPESPIRTITLLFVTACLLGAPSLVVTTYLPRYSVPAFIFGGLILFILIIWAANMFGAREQSNFVTGLKLSLIMLIFANVFTASILRKETFSGQLEAHELIAESVAKEKDKWPEDSQIVYLLPNDLRSPSSRPGHWATGYLRAVSDRWDIIGLVGKERYTTSDPFVDEWDPAGRNLYIDDDPLKGRVRMRGLERDRPTFVYKQNLKTKKMEIVDAAFRQKDGELAYIETGKSFSDAVIKAQPCKIEAGQFYWEAPHTNLSAAALTWVPLFEKTLDLSGDEFRIEKIQVEDGQHFRLVLELAPKKLVSVKKPFSDTYPPMPFRGPAGNLYQREGEYNLLYGKDPATVIKLDGYAKTTLRLQGIEGCRYEVIDETGQTFPQSFKSITGNWTLGKGFEQRYWAGVMTLKLETTK